MAIVAAPLNVSYAPYYDTTQATQIIRGTLTFSGSYVAGGDTVNFSTHAVGVGNPLASNRRCIGMQFWEEPASGTAVAGVAALMTYRNVAAKPSAANGVIQIVTAATISGTTVTAGTELGAGAYSATITGAKVFFEAIFVLGS